MPILQFRVSLPECSFPLWRRFQVTDDYPEPEDETTLHLRDFPLKPTDRMDYLYDFGDS